MEDFSFALERIKAGAAMCRKHWHGKGQWVMLHRITPMTKDMTANYLYLCTTEKQFIPWTPSMSDVLANDWMPFKE